MTEETYLARARRKPAPAGTPRELLHTMAAQADAGAPRGSVDEWTARLPGTTRQQTTRALARLTAAGYVAQDWDADRYLWTYRTTL